NRVSDPQATSVSALGVKFGILLAWMMNPFQYRPSGGANVSCTPPGTLLASTIVGAGGMTLVVVSRGVNGRLTPSVAMRSSQTCRLTTTRPPPTSTMLQSVAENDNSRPSMA